MRAPQASTATRPASGTTPTASAWSDPDTAGRRPDPAPAPVAPPLSHALSGDARFAATSPFRTDPFAIIGGLTCLALVGAYAPATSRRLVKVPRGVGLVTLALVAYIAFIQPVSILSSNGFVARNVPACVP